MAARGGVVPAIHTLFPSIFPRFAVIRPLGTDSHDARPSVVIVPAPLRRRGNPFEVILVENVFQHRVRRTVVPSGIIIMIEFDCCDGALTEVGTTPSAR